jgi:hypothetical protein
MAQDSYMRKVYKKSENGEYPYFRVYYDYIGSRNISGIEMVLHPDIIQRDIVNLLNDSSLAKIVKEVLPSEHVKMSLSRYHMTKNIVGFIGDWHRDGMIGKRESLHANIFLFDEKSLEVVPGSHDRELTEFEKNKLDKSASCDLKNTKHLSVSAGNILLFNPAILHRGISDSFRANIHFRFEVDSNYQYFYFPNRIGFNKNWVDILENKNSVIIDPNIRPYNNTERSVYIKRLIRTFVHYVFFFLPINSILFKRFICRPNLKLRHIFGSMDC